MARSHDSSMLGKRLLFSGEVDCMAMANGGIGSTGPPPPLGRREYVELKTQALLNNDRQIGIFEKCGWAGDLGFFPFFF